MRFPFWPQHFSRPKNKTKNSHPTLENTKHTDFHTIDVVKNSKNKKPTLIESQIQLFFLIRVFIIPLNSQHNTFT